MRLLVDTQAFLWWVDGSAKLSRKARRAVADPGNECLFSLASCWEMAIKLSLGKLRLDEPIDTFVPAQLSANRFSLLEIGFRHTARVAKLPFRHRDPFDRLLVAQALEEGLTVVTSDPVFPKYGVKRLW
jgi:PIN domain nuclease of toxin-antitoxin system